LSDGFIVKGKKFSLETLLQDSDLAKQYANGSMVIARLCPTDYHRFHFPCNCIPERSYNIAGDLFSVNPLALRKNIHILSQNKRQITILHSKNFGKILFIEVGATYVGSIHQTFVPGEPYAKGDEKGYFSFGGSSLILLFEPNCIQFDQDLIEASGQRMEIRGLMGQSMGRSLFPLGFDK
jgi:phosphatidylserine decarboxylase